ncbi:MAG: DMT family transporter [Candidatus Woesearchaeota archaeon]
MIEIFLGLIAMLCWGIADFLQAIAIKKTNSLKIMFFGNIIGFFPTFFAFLYFLSKGYIYIEIKNTLILFFSAFINLVAVYMFMKSFEEGEISIVTPISSSYSIITVILAVIFLKETLTLLKIISIILCILGIMLVSTNLNKLKHIKSVKGVKQAILAFIGWGFYFFLIGLVSKNLINIGVSKLISAISLFFITGLFTNIFLITFSYIKTKKNLFHKKLDKKIWLILLINFFLYNLAWISVNYGISIGNLSIITPISSLYPAITVLLAYFILREKLVLNQKIGIILTILAIFLISL